MGRVTKREWYQRVNAEWDGVVVPKLTFEEACRAAKRLYRFATGRTFKGTIRQTTGRRYTWIRRGVWSINSDKGWRDFVHLVSHNLERGKHGASHARMEMRLIKEVKRRGWLDGKLKSEPVEAKPVTVDIKLRHAQSMLKRAETRVKRATTIKKKWMTKVRYYERKANAQV